MSARLQAELQALGFDVQIVRDDLDLEALASPEGGPDSSLVSQGARAAVRIERGGRGVEIWVTDRRTRALAHWGVVTGTDPAVIALRAVEVLRTSVIDMPSIAANEPAPQPPDRDQAPPTSPSSSEAPGYRLFFGVAGGNGSSSFGVSWNMLASFRWTGRDGFGLEGLVLAPLGSSEVQQEAGSTEVSFFMAGIGAHWDPVLPPGGPWSVDFATGLSAVLLRARGVPSGGFVGHTNEALGAAPFLRAGASVAVGPAWRVRADAWAAAVVPRPVITIDTRTAFAWGRPLLLGSAGVELVWR
jgi:hypothetical protein